MAVLLTLFLADSLNKHIVSLAISDQSSTESAEVRSSHEHHVQSTSKSRKIIALFSFVKLFSVMAYMSGNYSCHPDNIHPASVSRIKIRVEKQQKTMRRLINSYSPGQKRLCPPQTTDKCRWIKKRSPRYIFTWWVGGTNILLLQTMAFVHLQVNIIIIIIININIINSIVVFIIWSIVL